VEKSTPFFCVDDSAEKGFFYSVNVRLTGAATGASGSAAGYAGMVK
jgi:hypothetical protein